MRAFVPILSIGLLATRPAAAEEPVATARAEEDPAPSSMPLVDEGEEVGGFVVERVLLHPEFQRFYFAGEGAPAPVELVEKPPLRSGICADHGLTLFPRWELRGATVPADPWIEGERAPETAAERLHADLCARLHARGASIHLGRAPSAAPPPRAADGAPAQARRRERDDREIYLPVGELPLSWLHLVLAPLLALGAALGLIGLLRLDRGGRRDLALVALVTVAVRLLLAPRVMFNGALASYEKVVLAWGFSTAPSMYGDGWGALMGPLHARFGLHPDVTFTGNLVLSCLAPVALVAVLRLLASAAAARLGGLLLAVWPLHVALSATEVMTMPVVTLSLVAMAAAARSGLPGGTAAGALAGMAAGFAVHVRPEAFLLLPAIAAAPFVIGRRRALQRAGPWLALVIGGSLVGLRWMALPPSVEASPMRLRALGDPTWWVMSLLPSCGSGLSPHHVFLDLRWTSPLAWLGAAAGLRARWRALPFLLGIAGTWVLLDKSWPVADALRLQVVAAPMWIGLAAVGIDRLLAGRRRAPWEAAAVVLVAVHLATGRLDLARHHEWGFLARSVPALPAGSVLRYDDTPHREDSLGGVLLALNPTLRVRGASRGRPADGELLLRGVSCLAQHDEAEERGAPSGCARIEAACSLSAEAETTVPARTDLDSRFDPADVRDGQVTIGLYRLEGCR